MQFVKSAGNPITTATTAKSLAVGVWWHAPLNAGVNGFPEYPIVAEKNRVPNLA